MDNGKHVTSKKYPRAILEIMKTSFVFLTLLGFGLTVPGDEFAAIDHVSFLEGSKPALTSPRTLGRFPHDCVGNLNHCPDGFTVSLQYNPAPSNTSLPRRYVLSSGGQSPLSEGFYFRQNYGREHELGVAKATKLWRLTFFLLEGEDAILVFTWKDSLTVYVDGIKIGQDIQGSDRLYTSPNIDLYPDVVVGKCNTDTGTDVIGVGVKVAEVMITSGVNAREPDDTAYTKIGCVVDLPKTVLDTASDLSSDNLVRECRVKCARDTKQIAVLEGSVCYCAAAGITHRDCESNSKYHLYWASHVTDIPSDWLTNIAVQVIKPTTKPYIRPEETVTFVISTSGPEQPTLHVDFDDGTRKIVPGKSGVRVSHAWEKVGAYRVNITAVSRTIVESYFQDITIKYIEEGRAPEQVYIKPDTRYDVTETGHVDIWLDAYSPKKKDCTAQLGPGDVKTYSGITDLMYSSDIKKEYPGIGMFNVSFQCSNDFGSTGSWQIAVSANPELQFTHHARPRDIDIPVIGAAVPTSDLSVFIDDRDETSHVIKVGDNVRILDDVVKYSGEHLIELKSSGKTVLSKLFNMQKEVADVSIHAPVVHTQVDEILEINFRIGQGDFIHIFLDFGDGTTESLFAPIADGLVEISRNHSYDQLGKHYIGIEVANDVSAKSFQLLVSVERPLVLAKMHGLNITTLGEATHFTFYVDMHIMPAMPVAVTFDYDNGVQETVILGEKQHRATKLVHKYIYPDYGIYRVKAVVHNNISQIAVATLVQVGQNITAVDAYVDTDKGSIGESFMFTIHCPLGSPIYVEMDMGDGEVMKTTRGASLSPTIHPSLALTEDPLQEVTVPGPARRKRSIEDVAPGGTEESITDEVEDMTTEEVKATVASHPDDARPTEDHYGTDTRPRPISLPNEPFILTYTYKTAGTFSVKVKVHNKFSKTESYLCPEIVISKSAQNQPTCDKFNLDVNSDSTEDKPLVNWRSRELNISTTFGISCDNNWLLRYTPRYTWKTQRKTSRGHWRPELDVCEAEMPDNTLIIPGNTLWYGTYRLTVTMTLRSINLMSRRRRSLDLTGNATIDSTLDVGPTDGITAEIRDTVTTLEKVDATVEAPSAPKKKKVPTATLR